MTIDNIIEKIDSRILEDFLKNLKKQPFFNDIYITGYIVNFYIQNKLYFNSKKYDSYIYIHLKNIKNIVNFLGNKEIFYYSNHIQRPFINNNLFNCEYNILYDFSFEVSYINFTVKIIQNDIDIENIIKNSPLNLFTNYLYQNKIYINNKLDKNTIYLSNYATIQYLNINPYISTLVAHYKKYYKINYPINIDLSTILLTDKPNDDTFLNGKETSFISKFIEFLSVFLSITKSYSKELIILSLIQIFDNITRSLSNYQELYNIQLPIYQKNYDNYTTKFLNIYNQETFFIFIKEYLKQINNEFLDISYFNTLDFDNLCYLIHNLFKNIIEQFYFIIKKEDYEDLENIINFLDNKYNNNNISENTQKILYYIFSKIDKDINQITLNLENLVFKNIYINKITENNIEYKITENISSSKFKKQKSKFFELKENIDYFLIEFFKEEIVLKLIEQIGVNSSEILTENTPIQLIKNYINTITKKIISIDSINLEDNFELSKILEKYFTAFQEYVERIDEISIKKYLKYLENYFKSIFVLFQNILEKIKNIDNSELLEDINDIINDLSINNLSDNNLSNDDLSDDDLSDNNLSDNDLSDDDLSNDDLSDDDLSNNEQSDNEQSDNEQSDNEESDNEQSDNNST